jgi:hypothetical protein
MLSKNKLKLRIAFRPNFSLRRERKKRKKEEKVRKKRKETKC